MFRKRPLTVRCIVGHLSGQLTKACRHWSGVYPASRSSFATSERSRVSVRVDLVPMTSAKTSRYGKFGCLDILAGATETMSFSASIFCAGAGREGEKLGERTGGL